MWNSNSLTYNKVNQNSTFIHSLYVWMTLTYTLNIQKICVINNSLIYWIDGEMQILYMPIKLVKLVDVKHIVFKFEKKQYK